MAVFLFPYTLWSVLQKPAPKEEENPAAKVVHAGVSDILKSISVQRSADDTHATADAESSGEPLEIVQLLIHSVTFLREIEKVQFVESNGRKNIAGGSEKNPVLTTNSSSSEHLNQKAYGCLVDVDLLDVALAAIRVKMPYSAMQYVEMWLEEKNGGMLPSLSSSSQVELDEFARRILVDATGFDNNVDGIYGINDSRTLESQLITYNQEGSFAKALPIYDVSLQSCPDGSGAAQRTQLLEGMFRSLRNLGYQNLLQGYLESLGKMISPATKISPEIEEHKYELAWKNLQWGSPGTALSSSDVIGSGAHSQASYCHQKVLFQALKALAHRDNDHLRVLINTSKEEILKSVQLGLCGLESTRDSYKALLWLESIRDIEETAKVVMGSSALDESKPSETYRPNSLELTNSLQKTCAESGAFVKLFEQWQKRYPRIQNDFDSIENLLALQEVLIKVAGAPNTHQILSRLHLSLASFSRKASRVAVAYHALTKLEQLHNQGLLGVHQRMQWKMEKAKLLWTQRETRSAIWTAKLLRSELEQTLEDPGFIGHRESLQMLQVAVLTVTGKWIASQRSENSQVIIEEYFHKATDLVDSLEADVISQRVGDAAKAHLALADYMADMHHQVHTRVTSREWLAGKRVAEARHRELKECLAMDQAKQIENRAHIHALNKEVLYDHEERTKVEASVDQFLTGALRSYGKGLALSPKAELAVVFRLLSLWFTNQSKAGTNKVVQEVIDAVPSYKFVPLSYQIISRIGSTASSSSSSSRGKTNGKSAADAFQRVLSVLVLKLCEQHPHHALVQLIALKNSGDVEGKGALEFRANVGDAKSEGAKLYLEKLRKTDQRELLESLDILSNAYIQLALFDTRDYHKSSKKIALSNVPIVELHPGSSSAVSFEHCLRDRTRRGATNRAVMPAVLTCNVTPRADMDYSGVVRVNSFEPMFSITDSGIHRPKIIYCYGSDGQRFKQLVKGKDDTRQDLVIEQAFETVNHFLKEDKQTRERKLRLRTYKVVPLSPIAGVLEWVDNTVPWGSYLVGRTAKRLSAHERYHPHEWKHADCRTYLKNATNKLVAYKKIEASFTPVFHHFFLEKFPDPAMWFRRRHAYVQSAAVTSIVGYILGIGDRHSQNILVHEETAELVHIDFGVVFDQGMALFTPETVPFRLTRDIVDGMGVSGCEGVFTRCCEATLQLLRKKSASVVTILEVFVHDPLYRWTLSPLKALRIQEGEEKGGTKSSSVSQRGKSSSGSHVDESDATGTISNADGNAGNNDAAARALIRVKQKLEGYEDPNGNALSIEGQVKQLISAAQDPHNLCNLFPGWAPWL
ncbi:Phosphatidylinositol kinase [Globisporangium polare]